MKFPVLLKGLSDDDNREKLYIFLIAAGAIIFYLPFLSKQFIGDDWLWLANAKKALTDPSIFIGRPMYGYFRPLNMVVICMMEYIFGPNARVFSLLSILLHATNVFLLWLVLKKYDMPRNIRLLAPFIFAFYYLNCAAIEWISVGHDLWVTGLMLIYLIRLKLFYEQPVFKAFIIMFLIGWTAALFKESGLVAVGFYFVFLILNRTNPFGKKYYMYSSIYISSYAIFLIYYFLTRTIADKQIVIGLPIIVNLWYFLIYLLLPLSKRIVEQLPGGILSGLVYIKYFIMIIIPILLVYVYIKGSQIIKIFVLWPIYFILTIAVFQWGITPFLIYPHDPASRFMYSPFVGMAVCIAWVVVLIVNRIVNGNLKPFIYIVIGILFITANYFIVSKSSLLYIKQQKLSQSVINDIQSNWKYFEKADTIVVLTNDLANTEQIIASGEHLPAILLVEFDKNVLVSVIIIEGGFLNMIRAINGKLIIGWSIEKSQLLFPTGYKLDAQVGRQ